MMAGPDPERVADLFARACDLPAEEQTAFLDRECGDDPTLRRELDALLQCDRGDGPLPRKKVTAQERASDPRLTQAVELWLRHLSESNGLSDTEFLERHPDLRPYLESLVENRAISLSAILGREGSPTAKGTPTPSLDEYLDKLRRHASSEFPFAVVGEVDEGGMGKILRVWDEDLRRHVAMKVIKKKARQGADHPSRPETLARFLDEALVTGQLDHPGIVPVHRLGVDAEGRIFFTMRLIRGTSLERTLPAIRSGDDAWTLARALEVVIKVCDTLAYAHAKKVVHRDLKPANVMLGRFGEVYVVDWGIAKLVGRDDPRDLEVSQALTTIVHHMDEKGRVVDGDSPHLSFDGMVVGTPAYMAPEQARGQIRDIGPRTDVYAVGAILYEILTGRAPYTEPGRSASSLAILRAVTQGPPRPVDGFETKIAPELCAIVEKAMAREIGERYATIQDVASDLRAFIENRVVRAHRTGAWVELRKWTWRHRGTAWTALAFTVLLLGAVTWFVHRLSRSEVHAKEAQFAAERSAEREREIAASLRIHAHLWEIGDLRRAERDLWPLREGVRPALVQWIERFEALQSAWRDPSLDLGERPAAGSAEQLDRLRRELSDLGRTEESDRHEATLASVRWRVREYDRIEALSRSAAADRAWEEARRAIQTLPTYHGVAPERRWDLLPLGADRHSGLWEFAHLPSGDVPLRGADGALQITESSGVVLVLIPGGSFDMGSSLDDEDGPNGVHDLQKDDPEYGVHSVTLAPYAIAKYETTQAQWLRWTGHSPSFTRPETTYHSTALTNTLLHPVEQVTHREVSTVLDRLGLELPTEAQWERAARANTATPWSFDPQVAGGFTGINVADAAATAEKLPFAPEPGAADSDGYPVHAPVDAFPPNPFGLHHVHGNVAEWCLDSWAEYTDDVRPLTGERVTPEGVLHKVVRGGSFLDSPWKARSGFRDYHPAVNREPWIGFRAALNPSR